MIVQKNFPPSHDPNDIDKLSNIKGDVSVYNSYSAVGDCLNNKVYIYKKNIQSFVISPPFVENDDKFGNSISLTKDIIIIGSYLDNTIDGINSGSAYLYQLTQSDDWLLLNKLTPSDSVATCRWCHWRHC